MEFDELRMKNAIQTLFPPKPFKMRINKKLNRGILFLSLHRQLSKNFYRPKIPSEKYFPKFEIELQISGVKLEFWVLTNLFLVWLDLFCWFNQVVRIGLCGSREIQNKKVKK
jgi:hypothetical protein